MIFKVNTRVYIDAKRVLGGWLASSSPTAITVRRDGTVTKVGKKYISVHFDDAPGRTTNVVKDCLRILKEQSC